MGLTDCPIETLAKKLAMTLVMVVATTVAKLVATAVANLATMVVKMVEIKMPLVIYNEVGSNLIEVSYVSKKNSTQQPITTSMTFNC